MSSFLDGVGTTCPSISGGRREKNVSMVGLLLEKWSGGEVI